MFKITYQPGDNEIIERMLAENGTYIVTVHNRHIVKCDKAVALDVSAPAAKGKKAPPENVNTATV